MKQIYVQKLWRRKIHNYRNYVLADQKIKSQALVNGKERTEIKPTTNGTRVILVAMSEFMLFYYKY